MTPTIPPSFVRLADRAYPIPGWHNPDPSAHAEVFMDDPPDVPPGFAADLAEQPDENNILRYSLRAIDLGERRTARLAELSAIRYAHEVAGTTWNDWPVNTDRDSQGKATGVHALASAGLWRDGSAWKFHDQVSRPLTSEQAQAMALAIAAHVQACFEVEAALASEIRSSVAPEEIDLTTGWPARQPKKIVPFLP